MAMLRPPAPGNATVDLNELAGLWLRGLNASHDAGCGCGGMFAPALNARIIEEDFLDYLFARYERESLGELAGFIDARRKDLARGVGVHSFERWIGVLGNAPLADAARERLVADIVKFVESMGGARRTPGICY